MRWRPLLAWILVAPFASMTSPSSSVWADQLEPASPDDSAIAITRRAEDSLRGDRTVLDGMMVFGTRQGASEEAFQLRAFYDRARNRAFVRIQGAGNGGATTFLKLPPNVWKYDPKEAKTYRLPVEELQQPIGEGAFTAADLVRDSSLLDDYDPELLGIDPRPDRFVDRRAYVLQYTPRGAARDDAGRVVAWIDTEWGTPLRYEYHDADGQLRRVVHFGEIREVQERFFPHVWVAQSQDDPRHETRIEIEQVRFDAELDPEIFTPRHLKATE